MEIFAVTGNPILHSMSPILFNAAYGSQFVYTRIIARSVAEVLTIVKILNIYGINITAPYKNINLWEIGDNSLEVRNTGATNTVILKNGEFKYYNSDVSGVQNSLPDVKDKICVVVGAGGAAVASAYALKQLGGEVMVINRTESKAAQLATLIGCKYSPIEHLEYNIRKAEIIVTTVDLIDAEWINEKQIYLDAKYNSPTLKQKVKINGAQYIDGYEWLINQAVVSYRIFTEMEPNIEAMRLAISTIRESKKRVCIVGNFDKIEQLIERLSQKLSIPVHNVDNIIDDESIVIGVCDTTKTDSFDKYIHLCDAVVGTFKYSIEELNEILYAEISRTIGD